MPPTDKPNILLELLGSRTVAYKPAIARLVGGVKAGVLLSQMLWLDFEGRSEGDPGDPFEITIRELEIATVLNDKEQRSARSKLTKLGILKAERHGMPARYSYQLNHETLIAVLSGQLRLVLDGPTESPKGHIKSRQKGTSRVAKKAHQESHFEDPVLDLKDSKSKTLKKKRGPAPPAVELFRRINHRYPPKKLHGMIDRKVGRSFLQLLRWGRIIRSWIAQGYNPINYKGMLDVLESGWIDGLRRGSKSSALGDLAAAHKKSKARESK